MTSQAALRVVRASVESRETVTAWLTGHLEEARKALETAPGEKFQKHQGAVQVLRRMLSEVTATGVNDPD